MLHDRELSVWSKIVSVRRSRTLNRIFLKKSLSKFEAKLEANQNMINRLVSNFYNKLKISRTFLRAKQVVEKRAKFQFVLEIAQQAFILILVSL